MNKVSPRVTPLRDDYYMGKAFWEASKSKDPRSQVGAVIISSQNEPLGTGYNGPPSDIPDHLINWDRPDKYPYIHHAEDNAICFSRGATLGATLYVTAPPCSDCMLDIVRAKIKRVVYFEPKIDSGSSLNDKSKWEITKNMAKWANVELVKFKGNLNWMRDRIKWMEKIGVFD